MKLLTKSNFEVYAATVAENDNELLNELKLEYSVKLAQRKEWRYQLNNLE